MRNQTLRNPEVRAAIRARGFNTIDVAEAMGLSESAFYYKLRKNLSAEEKMEIIQVIMGLKREAS